MVHNSEYSHPILKLTKYNTKILWDGVMVTSWAHNPETRSITLVRIRLPQQFFNKKGPLTQWYRVGHS